MMLISFQTHQEIKPIERWWNHKNENLLFFICKKIRWGDSMYNYWILMNTMNDVEEINSLFCFILCMEKRHWDILRTNKKVFNKILKPKLNRFIYISNWTTEIENFIWEGKNCLVGIFELFLFGYIGLKSLMLGHNLIFFASCIRDYFIKHRNIHTLHKIPEKDINQLSKIFHFYSLSPPFPPKKEQISWHIM